MNIEINMNINDFVECQLTEHGVIAISSRGYKPELSEGNFIRIQLWELANHLGDSLFNGAEQSIVDNRITIMAKTNNQPTRAKQ